jgi:hypothetical protein
MGAGRGGEWELTGVGFLQSGPVRCLPLPNPVGVETPCLPQQTNEGGHGGTAPTQEKSDRYVTWRAGKKADINKCLTLDDIFGLQLKQCRLVVFSACKTTLIDTQNPSDIGLGQKKQILKELDGYNDDEKPYGDIYHWGAFCAIGL